MFKAANPYDDIVLKATAETLTSEDWQVNLDICDKISTEGETGARNAVSSLQKRLVHRNANVQLYSLTLSDAIAKNCGIEAHRELASRAFTQTLSRVITDRNTHEKVRSKTLELLKEWEKDFVQSEETSSMVKETIDALRAQGYYKDERRYESGSSNDAHAHAPPAEPSSEQLRREDEELRRVLELSLQDQGGRGAYGSQVNGQSQPQPQPQPQAQASGSRAQQQQQQQASWPGAAVAAATDKTLPDPNAPVATQHPSATTSTQAAAAPAQQQQQPQPNTQPRAPSRVRALYDFTPTEIGELAFSKGDVIRVLDSVYEHWWRGEIRGEAGIFPVNYVEILPDPTPAEIQREAEQEAQIFAQAHDIDRLLSRLRTLDPHTANLAEDEELQDLYQSSLAMRPKIVKLIDRYSGKVQELRAMNDKFVRARSAFDGMMEGSARAGQQPQQAQQAQQQAQQGYYPQQQSQQQGYDAQQQPQQQGYYAQQPQQQQQQYYPQQQQQPHTHPQGYGSQPPQEDEKRRLYEQARREAEAYHAAYGQQQQGSVGGGSHSGGQEAYHPSQPQ